MLRFAPMERVRIHDLRLPLALQLFYRRSRLCLVCPQLNLLTGEVWLTLKPLPHRLPH